MERKNYNILLFTGGESSEHEVSLLSSEFLLSHLNQFSNLTTYKVLILKDGQWEFNKKHCSLNSKKELLVEDKKIKIDFAIPYIHGTPGETGQLSALLELNHIPYLGPSSEALSMTFNKATTKLWLDHFKIKNTRAAFLTNSTDDSINMAAEIFNIRNDVFIKASNQGSSVGCFHVTSESDLKTKIDEAFNYSPFVIVEETIQGRELEVSAFEYQGKIHITPPGEIRTPNNVFYDYDQKYRADSDSSTIVKAQDISDAVVLEIQTMAKKAFEVFKLKDLSRVDFFLTNQNEVILNEINAFPGMTPISMFPKMMENSGVLFSDFLADRLKVYNLPVLKN